MHTKSGLADRRLRGPQRTNRGGDRRTGESSLTTNGNTPDAPTTFSTTVAPPIITASGPMMDLLSQVSGGCLPLSKFT